MLNYIQIVTSNIPLKSCHILLPPCASSPSSSAAPGRIAADFSNAAKDIDAFRENFRSGVAEVAGISKERVMAPWKEVVDDRGKGDMDPRQSMGLAYLPISWGCRGQCMHIFHIWSVWG